MDAMRRPCREAVAPVANAPRDSSNPARSIGDRMPAGRRTFQMIAQRLLPSLLYGPGCRSEIFAPGAIRRARTRGPGAHRAVAYRGGGVRRARRRAARIARAGRRWL